MIGGFVKNSFIDYPGKIAATIFFRGCNFYCPFCHNPDLLKKSNETYDFEKILVYLNKARKIIDGVCLSGGESLLYDNIEDYIYSIKNLGLKVKIDTNGALPQIIQKLDVDYIAMDIKTIPSRYTEFTKIENIADKITTSINYLLTSNIEYEFRTTLVPGFIDEKEIKEIGSLIRNARKWILQPYSNKTVLDPEYHNIQPYSIQKNAELLAITKTFVPTAHIR